MSGLKETRSTDFQEQTEPLKHIQERLEKMNQNLSNLENKVTEQEKNTIIDPALIQDSNRGGPLVVEVNDEEEFGDSKNDFAVESLESVQDY